MNLMLMRIDIPSQLIDGNPTQPSNGAAFSHNISEHNSIDSSVKEEKLSICKCHYAKVGFSRTASGMRPCIILELLDERTGEKVVKFFNSKSKSKGVRTVARASDFAKLYRLTFGDIDPKRFSRAQQLMKHFVGKTFLVKHKPALEKDGSTYLKASFINPQIIYSNDCAFAGTTKIPAQKMPTKEVKTGEAKSLQAPKTLGLEPVFNPIITSTK